MVWNLVLLSVNSYLFFGPKEDWTGQEGLKENKSLLPKRNDDNSFQEGLFEMWIKHLILSPVAK